MDQPENKSTSPGFFGSFSATALFLWDFLKIIIIALVIILPIRYFIFQPFIVSGSSMDPTFHHGEYLIIDELSYHFKDPERGQVIVLKYPKDRKQFFIKRIIGLPGEKVEIDDGHVTIYNSEHPNGVVLEEEYLPNSGLTYPHDTQIIGGQKIVTLKDDEYIVLGDNRLGSSDSRDWGILKRSDMVGKVFMRVLPLSEFDVYVHAPSR